MKAMAENQKAIQNELGVQAARSEQDWRNYEKLAGFSKTLSDNLVDNQKKENKRVMMENINQAFLDGGDPNKQADYQAKVDTLDQLDNIEREIAADFKRSGGPVDVANEIKKRSGWAAYGYAVGVARQGAANYDSFREQNKDREIGEKANGDPLSLGNATNRAEWRYANQLLRDEYMQPYLGLNQEMLNKEMIEPMRETETLAFSTWQEELATKEEAEENLARMGALYESMQRFGQTNDVLPVIKDIETMIQKVTIDNGGFAGAGRKDVAKLLFDLADKGVITPGQAVAILKTKYPDRNGQMRSLGKFVEFRGLAQRANDAAQKAWNFQTAQKRREARAEIKKIEDSIATKGLLTKEEAETVKARLSSLSVPAYEYQHLLETKDDKLADQAENLFDAGVRNGTYIPEAAIKHLPRELIKQAQQHNARLQGGYSEMDRYQEQNVVNWIDTVAARATNTAVLDPDTAANNARLDIKAEWDRWWLENRVEYNSVEEAIRAGKAEIEELVFPKDDPNQPTKHGWELSTINHQSEDYKARRQTTNDLFKRNLQQASGFVKTQLSEENFDFFTEGLIPGTGDRLKLINDRYLKTGILYIDPIYRNMLQGPLNGKMTPDQLIRAQLKAVYGTEVKEPELKIPEPKEMRPEVMRLLSVHPTANTLYRYSIDTNAGGTMENASQQGALSDPNNPNSPRIGQWVGGDNMNVSYTGQGGPEFMLDTTQVPRGLGYVVENAAQKYGIPPHVLAGLIEQESGWDPQAYNSGSGATGIAQIVPKWHPEANPGVNAADDIMYAAKYLRELMTNYGFDLETAIYAYNAGPNTVLKYGKGASRENRNYYPGVMEKSERYRRRSYGPVRPKYEQLVQDSPYNSPDLLSPVLRDRIYTLA